MVMSMATVRGNPTAWDSFYKTARWQRLRKLQLRQRPLCKFCLERGIVTAANVVDHVTPHRGDWNAFVLGELQSLCEPCHNAAKRQIELRGYRDDIGIDGYPTDPNHPFNRAR
jgi:5-methylcytosine-specific restriction endonuclease McrA